MKAITTLNLTKIFGSGSDRVVALDDVSVDINENEFFTLLGPSGCGKTTLLRLIAGFEAPNAGSIHLYGESIAHLPPYQRPVNTVFQSYALFPHMSVAENISFGLQMLDKPKKEINETTDRMLELVQMHALRDRQTSQISGGQQQRVALARALAPHPKVLLLDEPLSALDFKLRKEMQLELKRLQAETGITFVFVTHDQDEALTMSDRIAVMNHGQIRQIGTPRNIYAHPAERFVSDFIGESNYLSARVQSIEHDNCKLELDGGATLSVATNQSTAHQSGETVTVMVRPEHADISSFRESGNDGGVAGTVTDAIYSGTDTRYHISLDSGDTFVVRRQNTIESDFSHQKNERVSVNFHPQSMQILDD